MNCPKCGSELGLAEYPDTGTSVDCYEGKCKKGHVFEIQIENQTGRVSLSEIGG